MTRFIPNPVSAAKSDTPQSQGRIDAGPDHQHLPRQMRFLDEGPPSINRVLGPAHVVVA